MASAVLKIGRLGPKFVTFTRLKTACPIKFIERNFIRNIPLCGTTELAMPALSPTMTEGTIVKWYKKEGDSVAPGDILCDIQTDKAVVSMDIEEEGVLAKILKPENSKYVKIGTLIALMVEEGDDWENVEVPTQGAGETQSTTQAATEPAAAAATSETRETHDGHAQGIKIGPSVRKLMDEYSFNIAEVPGSGPHHVVTKGDVMKYIKSKNLQKGTPSVAAPSGKTPTQPVTTPPEQKTPPSQKQAPPPALPEIDGEDYIDIPNSSMRTTIAKRLTLSKTTIPHSYVTASCNVGPVTSLRKRMIAEGVKVSVNDFIVKAAAIALQRVPRMNSVWQGDEVKISSTQDVCVAVATQNGLITPIVKNAAQLGVDQISDTVKDLASRARENKLQLHEFQGGSFTISNLGMYGISEFSAVINPPQTAIMAIGSSQLVLGEDGKPESQMKATLSYDARVVDEAEASEFMEVFRDVMENPQMTIVGSSLNRKLREMN